MRWFRLYSDLLNDPKAQRLSPALFKHWINLLCLANVSEPRGVLPAEHDIAFNLRIRPFEVRKIMAQLVDAGLMERRDDGRFAPHNWEERQRRSDDINERVRRHRAQNAPANGRDIDAVSAPNQRAINAPSTDTRRKVGAPPIADAASFPESSAIGNGNVTLHATLQKRPVDIDIDGETEKRDSGSSSSVAKGKSVGTASADANDAPNGKPRFAEQSDPLRLATYLKARILAHKPDARLPANLQGWAREFDLMLRVEKRTTPGIKAVIEYATSDPFWRGVIFSAGKIRQKYDPLDTQRQERAHNDTNNGTYQRSAEAAAARAVADEETARAAAASALR